METPRSAVVPDYYSLLDAEIRDAIRDGDLDPYTSQDAVEGLIRSTVSAYERRMVRASLPPLENVEEIIHRLRNDLCGYGPLQPYLDDEEVEEIWINSPDEIFVARAGESELTGLHLSDEAIQQLLERMLKPSGRRVDLSSPFVDASLPDGSRLHAVIPDITRAHTSLNIRKFVVRAKRLPDLVKLGSLSAGAASFLHAAVESGVNILVSGATQAGKTTMLNCLAASIPPRERVVTCEEIFELSIPLRDVVGMQCRQPNLEGKGAIALRRLVKEALRMRPDRLLIGEVREAESLDMLIALNAGLPGMCTIHANSARDAVTKICTLPLLAGANISSAFVVPTVASCFDLVIHCGRDTHGHRQVEEIYMLGGRVEDGVIEMSPLFTRQQGEMVCVALEIPTPEKWVRAGHRPDQVLAAAKVGR